MSLPISTLADTLPPSILAHTKVIPPNQLPTNVCSSSCPLLGTYASAIPFHIDLSQPAPSASSHPMIIRFTSGASKHKTYFSICKSIEVSNDKAKP